MMLAAAPPPPPLETAEVRAAWKLQLSEHGLSSAEGTISTEAEDDPRRQARGRNRSFAPATLFAWWPPREGWTRSELAERCTACLPAVRPGLDLVALPSIPEVRLLWKSWSRAQGLQPWQVVWFAPRLDVQAARDPVVEAAKEVLNRLKESLFVGPLRHATPLQHLNFYPALATPELVEEASVQGMQSVTISARGTRWAHPLIAGTAGEERAPRLADLLPPGAANVRACRGYEVASQAELAQAFRQLRRECPPGTQLELRPARGSLRPRLLKSADEKDLDAFFSGDALILEEASGGPDGPVLYTLCMTGSAPCPRFLFEDLPQGCLEVAQQIGENLQIEGPWSVDFALDVAGTLVVHDVRECHADNLTSVREWARRTREPVAVCMVDYRVPQTGAPSLKEVTKQLFASELAWDGDEGAVAYQHAPGGALAFAVASSFGAQALEVLRGRIAEMMLESDGLVAERVRTVL